MLTTFRSSDRVANGPDAVTEISNAYNDGSSLLLSDSPRWRGGQGRLSADACARGAMPLSPCGSVSTAGSDYHGKEAS